MFHNKENDQLDNQFSVVGENVSTQINAQMRIIDDRDSRKRQRRSSSVSDIVQDIKNPVISGSKSTKKSRMYSDGPLSKLHAAKNAGVFGSKACLEGTRVALLGRINNWALDSTGKRALLLTGAAGMGKSAIAHTIAKQLESSKGAIVPFFAFDHSVPERSASQLIPTWVKHLAENNFDYYNYLK
ncbi:hypothetical protein H0H92_000630, partial [Tricholoma furcatifolium]